VVVDLEGCFTSGQAYVALSRARTVAGLRVRHYHPHLVKADPRALAFYDALNRQCAALASSSSASSASSSASSSSASSLSLSSSSSSSSSSLSSSSSSCSSSNSDASTSYGGSTRSGGGVEDCDALNRFVYAQPYCKVTPIYTQQQPLKVINLA
jgi:hypothetical protein